MKKMIIPTVAAILAAAVAVGALIIFMNRSEDAKNTAETEVKTAEKQTATDEKIKNTADEEEMSEVIQNYGGPECTTVPCRAHLFGSGKNSTPFSGEFDGTELSDGNIVLSEGRDEGIFTSEPVDIGKFNTVYMSWNSLSHGGTVEIGVYIEKSDGSRSDPYSWGKWSDTAGVSASTGAKPGFASLSIDTLSVKGSHTGRVRYFARLTRGDSSPEVSLISVATDGDPLFAPEDKDYGEFEIDVPARVQGVVPEIGGRICSPTSLAMLLEYHGVNLGTAEVAEGAHDNRNDKYGNWSFNTAFAGEQGLEAYVDVYDMDMLKYTLSQGVPVAITITTQTSYDIDDSPHAHPYGHLIVACGIKTVDGVECIAVNDPDSRNAKAVRRYFPAEQLANFWNGITYVVQERI